METLQFASGVVSLCGAILLGFIILNPHIHEGGIIKVGLVMMAMALWVTAVHALGRTDNWYALWAAGFTLRLGMLVVGLGVIFRWYKRGSWDAALSNWGALR